MPLIKHELVPEHKIATKEEVEELKRKYGISLLQLPLILSKDPMVKAIGAKKGDVIKIIRKSPIAGETIYYRYVV
ncbi:MAG: DNA-directed RNA polymerase subunit H [Candidatus Asgardarchaeia archaeon]